MKNATNAFKNQLNRISPFDSKHIRYTYYQKNHPDYFECGYASMYDEDADDGITLFIPDDYLIDAFLQEDISENVAIDRINSPGFPYWERDKDALNQAIEWYIVDNQKTLDKKEKSFEHMPKVAKEHALYMLKRDKKYLSNLCHEIKVSKKYTEEQKRLFFAKARDGITPRQKQLIK